jgi:hypothetical protein
MEQSTQNVGNRLKALQGNKQLDESTDVVRLIKLLKMINFDEQKNVINSLLSVDENFHKYY